MPGLRSYQLSLLCAVSVLLFGCDASAPTGEPPALAADTTPPANPSALGLPPPVAQAKIEHFANTGPVQTTVLGEGEGPYQFSAPWHLKRISSWTTLLADSVGKPGLRYLEVGVYEGRSLLWMVENVLTDPSTELVAVDIFAGDYEQTFDHNIAASGASARITKHKGPSSEILRNVPLGKFDIIYIDGSHTADDVLADAVLAWGLLPVGGLMIFDDYEWTGRDPTPLPPELLPRVAVDLFIASYRYEIEVVLVGYQIAVRRVINPCKPKDYCSTVGQYQYYWRDYELRRGDEIIALTDAERGLIEAIARSRPLGQFEHQIPPNIRAAEPFKALVKRLDLTI